MTPLLADLPALAILFMTVYFQAFILTTYLEDRDYFRFHPTPERDPSSYPGVSIIVPAWNEERTIAGTIDSLLALDYPKEKLHIFVVDDGSKDNTFAVAKEYADRDPRVQVFRKENGGKFTAMNFALERISSPLVGCLDADSFVDSAALKEIVPFFDDQETQAVTPSVQIHKPETLLQKIQSAEYMAGGFARKTLSRVNGLYVTPGPFSIYRRSVFEKIGGFVHGYGAEDMEMALRMQTHNMKIDNAHAALVYTVSPRTLRTLFRQRVRWVSGHLQNAFFSYPHMFFNPKYGPLGILILPFVFFYIIVALWFSAQYFWRLFENISHWIDRVRILGWDAIHWPVFSSFDWFSIDFGMKRLIMYLVLVIGIFFVLKGGWLAKRKWHFSLDMLFFMVLYGLIAPFWLLRSIWNFIRAKEAPWR